MILELRRYALLLSIACVHSCQCEAFAFDWDDYSWRRLILNVPLTVGVPPPREEIPRADAIKSVFDPDAHFYVGGVARNTHDTIIPGDVATSRIEKQFQSHTHKNSCNSVRPNAVVVATPRVSAN
jgi:hypothetical protein